MFSCCIREVEAGEEITITRHGEPVARLTLEPSATLTLPYPGRDRLDVMWQPMEALEGTPHVFVHVIGQPGEVLRTYDHPFPGDWSPGQDHFEVTVPIQVEGGVQTLTLFGEPG